MARNLSFPIFHRQPIQTLGIAERSEDLLWRLTIAAGGLALEEQIQLIEEMADRLLGTALPIAVDEWNILGPLRRFTDPYQTQREAIGVAGIIRKSRKVYLMRNIRIHLDEVEGLGRFAELELVVDANGLETAKSCIVSLAKHLGLEGSERRSYLELLMS